MIRATSCSTVLLPTCKRPWTSILQGSGPYKSLELNLAALRGGSSGLYEDLEGILVPVLFYFRDPGPTLRPQPFPSSFWEPESLTSVQPAVFRNHLLVGRVPASFLGRAQ
jgi:hypothetical protein